MKYTENRLGRPLSGLIWTMTIVCLAVLFAPATTAQDEMRRELQKAAEEVELLLEKAEKLEQKGELERAAELRHKARDLRAKIGEARARMGREREEERGELEEILHGLEYGMEALEKLGRREELHMLARVAEEVRAEMTGGRKERRPTEKEIGLQQIETMRLAMKAVLEAGRKDTAEILEHAIHARELAMEGRRDEEAMGIRKSAPELGVQVEILMYAADLWNEFGHEEKAAIVRELSEVFRKKLERQRKGSERERGGEEGELARHQIEVMESALHVLREAEKEDAAYILKRAIQTRIVNVQGLKGGEADIVRERTPPLEHQVEVLGLASRLCREWGMEEKAHAIGSLAEQMWAGRKEKAGREQNADKLRIRELEERMGHMARQIEELKHTLRELERDR